MLKQTLTIAGLASLIMLAGTDISKADYNSHNNGYKAWTNSRNATPAPQYKRYQEPVKYRQTVLRKQINQRIKNDVLPLRRLVGLGKDYKGYTVDSVMVKIRPHRNNAKLNLRVNNRVVDRKRTRSERWVKLDIGQNRTVGEDLNKLELAVKGKVFIEGIKIKVSKPVRRHVRYQNTHFYEDRLRIFLNGLNIRF